MSRRSRGSRALLVLALVLPAMLGSLLLVVALVPGARAREVFLEGLSGVVPVIAYLATGTLVELRRPGNRVARALLLTGFGFWSETMLRTYANLALFVRPAWDLPLGLEAAAVSTACWTAMMAGVFLLVVTFPSGVLPSRRWRPVVAGTLVGFAVTAVSAVVAPGELEAPFTSVVNPLGLEVGLPLEAVAYVLLAGSLLALAAGAVDLVRRFRRAVGAEREQFKWLALSAAFLVAAVPVAMVLGFESLAGGLVGAGLFLLPVSVAIAVTRHRLYEVDRIISRTLVYGALTVVLGTAYVSLVLAGQALFSSFAGGSNLAIAVSTLVVAALFLPVRARVQSFVDRRFYRRRYDAQRTLEAFGARLREQVEMQALAVDLRGAVDETMQPTHVSLWLREGAR